MLKGNSLSSFKNEQCANDKPTGSNKMAHSDFQESINSRFDLVDPNLESFDLRKFNKIKVQGSLGSPSFELLSSDNQSREFTASSQQELMEVLPFANYVGGIQKCFPPYDDLNHLEMVCIKPQWISSIGNVHKVLGVSSSWICSECSFRNSNAANQCLGCKKMTNPQHLRSMSGDSAFSPKMNHNEQEQDIVDQLTKFGYSKSAISKAMNSAVNKLDINEVVEHIKQPNAPFTV